MNNGKDVAETPVLNRLPMPAAVVGVIGLAASGAVAWQWPSQFYPAYLVAFLFWIGLSLGCLVLTMLHHLVGGNWAVPLRRPMEAGAMTLPLMAALFVPISFGLRYLYPWANPSLAEQTKALLEAIERKEHYLNANMFMLRAAGYFVVWIITAFFVTSWSAQQDTDDDDRPSRRLAAISGPGIVLFVLTMSLAAVDWMMSLEPEWASTIYGVMIIVGQGLLTFASMILVAAVLGRSGPLSHYVTKSRLGDLGNLLLAFVMLWAYMSFSQFMIIWAGNLAEEIPWYLKRTRGGWQWVVLTLILFHFFAPFFVLLFRDSKRRIEILAGVAIAIIALHLLDIIWLVLPAHSGPFDSTIPWTQVAIVPLAWVGIGGVWLAWFALRLRSRPLIPLRDPAIIAALEHDGEH